MMMLDEIRWGNDGLWWLLLVPAALVPAYVAYALFRRRVAAALAGRSLLRSMIQRGATWRLVVSAACVVLALALLGLAAMRPRYGLKEVTVKGRGIDICLVLDASRSMKAADVAPDRLAAATTEIGRMLDEMRANRVALVPFAGLAFVQSPLTLDYEVIREYLRELRPTDVPVPGTALGRALKAASGALSAGREDARQEAPRRVVIVFTDGENHEGDPLAVAKEIGAQGVRIITVGVGTPAGQPIPILDENGAAVGTAREKDGTTPILSKLNEDLLKQIANAGEGRYFGLSAGSDVTEDLLRELAAVEKAEYQARVDRLREDRFQIPLAAALALMVVPFLLLGGGRLVRGVRVAAVLAVLLWSGGAQARGWLETAHGAVEDALEQLRQGAAGDAAKALADLADQKDLKGRPDLLYDIALARDRAGMHAEAVKALDDALALMARAKEPEPDWPAMERLLHAKGTILAHQARALPEDRAAEARTLYRQAVDAFTQALILAPESEDTRRNLELAAIAAYPPCSKLDDKAEPNDVPGEAKFVTPDPNTLEANLDLLLCPDNQDWFKLPVNQGETLFVAVVKPEGGQGQVQGQAREQGQVPAEVDVELLAAEGARLSGPGKEAVFRGREQTQVMFKVTGPRAEDGVPYRLTVRLVPPCPKGDDSFEDNDTREVAKPVPEGRHGARVCPGDDDWFQFTEKQGTQKQVLLQVPEGEGPLEMDVLSADGTSLDVRRETGQNGAASALLPKAENEAPFQIRVYGGGGEGFYSLAIQDPQGGQGGDNEKRKEQQQQGSQTMRDLLESIDRNDENLEAKEAMRQSPYREYVPEKDW